MRHKHGVQAYVGAVGDGVVEGAGRDPGRLQFDALFHGDGLAVPDGAKLGLTGAGPQALDPESLDVAHLAHATVDLLVDLAQQLELVGRGDLSRLRPLGLA